MKKVVSGLVMAAVALAARADDLEYQYLPVATGVAESDAVRVDLRDTLGGKMVTGIEIIGTVAGESVREWDSTQEANGWATVTDVVAGTNTQLFVVNDAGVAVEGGRLAESTNWTDAVTHVIRHTVVVPSGVTLTIGAGAVVKFCPGTEIFVEDGGCLAAAGTDAANAVFTGVNDDAAGVPIGGHGVEASVRCGAIRLQSGSARFTDTGYLQVQNINVVGQYPTVTIHGAQADRSSGAVWLMATLSGASRAGRFSVDWTARDGSAKFGEDYTLASGRIVWGNSNEGTKWFKIPLVTVPDKGEWRDFTVELTSGNCVNFGNASVMVTIQELGAARVSASSEAVPVDTLMPERLLFAADEVPLCYSPTWAESGDAAGLASVIALDGGDGARTLFTGGRGESGVFGFDLSELEIGEYLLTHKAVDAQNRVRQLYSKQFMVFSRTGVMMHGGPVTSNEVWRADVVHIVYQTVTVPPQFTLEIERGAIVKFLSGTGIHVEAGGARTVADDVKFTHINDDSLGGDTMRDGAETAPLMDSYTLSGNFDIMGTCEVRYRTQPPLSGRITESLRLYRGSVYKVNGNLILASGATLTIPAGTILKMGSGVTITVSSGATLDAQGTRAAPVVFTSYRDDAHGGDTNEDGDATQPNMGDWGGVLIKGGSASCMDCKFMYGGGVDGNQYGARANVFMWDNGCGTFRNCDFIDSTMDGCFAQNATFENCVFVGNDRGLVSHTGAIVANNCVFFQNRIGFFKHGGSLTVRNSISAWNTAYGVDSDAGSLNATYCCFWNPEGRNFGSGDVSESQNLVFNPLFADPDNFDFTIRAGSPCIDAGDGTVAPEFDRDGRPRANVNGSTKSGRPNADGYYPDIGVSEAQSRNVASMVDLAAVSVSAPKIAEAGAEIKISWETRNVGQVTGGGSWRDVVKLVSEYGASVILGEVVTEATIPTGAVHTVTAKFTVSAVSEGKWFAQVQVNAYRDVWEGSATGNNTATATDAVTVSAPGVTTAETLNGWLGADGIKTIKLTPDAAQDRIAAITLPAGATARYGVGFMPSEGYASGTLTGSGLFKIPAGDTPVYVVIEASKGGAWQMDFADGSLAVGEVSPNVVPSSGMATVRITGAGFTTNTVVELRRANDIVVADKMNTVSGEEILAVFDCARLKAGQTYGIVVTDYGVSENIDNAVTVDGSDTKDALTVTMDMPTSVRSGRVYTLTVHYRNDGITTISPPLFTVYDPYGGKTQFSMDGENWHEGSYQFLGLDTHGGFDGLLPGDEMKMSVYAKMPTDPNVVAGYAVKAATANDALARSRVEWSNHADSRMIAELCGSGNDEDRRRGELLTKIYGSDDGEMIINFGKYAKLYFDATGDVSAGHLELVKMFAANYETSLRKIGQTVGNDQPTGKSVVRLTNVSSSTASLSEMSLSLKSSMDDVRGTYEDYLATGIYFFKYNGNTWAKLGTPAVSGLSFKTKKVIIISHGWKDHIGDKNGNAASGWMYEMASALNKVKPKDSEHYFDYILAVNWGYEAADYETLIGSKAAMNIRPVALRLLCWSWLMSASLGGITNLFFLE